jgi:hypothetical protein
VVKAVLRYQAFNSASAPGQQLVAHTADPGSASAEKLARLVEETAGPSGEGGPAMAESS